MEILIKDQKISCEYISRKRKTLEIQIQPDGTLRVLAPKGLKKEKVLKTIRDKEDWIVNKIQEINSRAVPGKPEFKEQELHYGFGNARALSFISAPENKKLAVDLKSEGFVLSGRDFHKDRVRSALEEWYRFQTEKRVAYFVKKYRNSLPRPAKIQVKTQKKRWGSCNHKGKVMFNWKLSMAPAWVLEYLVVHELSHMEEFNHSKNFWALVRKTCPRCDEARDWLKKNQWKFQRFD